MFAKTFAKIVLFRKKRVRDERAFITYHFLVGKKITSELLVCLLGEIYGYPCLCPLLWIKAVWDGFV